MNVREIITTNLNTRGLGSYATHAEPIITEIETRLDEAVENLTSFAVNQGLSREEARRAFEEAGLVQPVIHEAATPEAVISGDGDLAATLNRINERLDGLEAIARRYVR